MCRGILIGWGGIEFGGLEVLGAPAEVRQFPFCCLASKEFGRSRSRRSKSRQSLDLYFLSITSHTLAAAPDRCTTSSGLSVAISAYLFDTTGRTPTYRGLCPERS